MTEIFKDPPSLSDWVDAKEWEESTKAEVLNLRDWTVCTNRVWQSEERAIDRLGGDLEVDKSDFLPVEFEVTVKFIVYQKAGIGETCFPHCGVPWFTVAFYTWAEQIQMWS